MGDETVTHENYRRSRHMNALVVTRRAMWQGEMRRQSIAYPLHDVRRLRDSLGGREKKWAIVDLLQHLSKRDTRWKIS